MNRPEVAIFCAGSLGKELVDFLKSDGYSDIVFIDDVIGEKTYYGFPVYRFDEFCNRYIDCEILVATGEPIYREMIAKKIDLAGGKLGVYCSSRAILGSESVLKPGAIVLPYAYISVGVEIGYNSIVHVGAKVEEGCKIGKNTFVSLGAFIGAKTCVGDLCFIGPNVTIRDHLLIDDKCIIGMASCVTASTASGVYIGNPARKISEQYGLVFK